MPEQYKAVRRGLPACTCKSPCTLPPRLLGRPAKRSDRSPTLYSG